jgi:hypothetical protein
VAGGRTALLAPLFAGRGRAFGGAGFRGRFHRNRWNCGGLPFWATPFEGARCLIRARCFSGHDAPRGHDLRPYRASTVFGGFFACQEGLLVRKRATVCGALSKARTSALLKQHRLLRATAVLIVRLRCCPACSRSRRS